MLFKISFKDIAKDKLENLACCDLGAFNQIGKNCLINKGISQIIIMEDRLPDFFFGYDQFYGHEDTTLNRHGPFHFLSTHQDLKDLVNELHGQAIKVIIGFWGQLLNPNERKKTYFIDNHAELWRLYHANNQNFDFDPLVTLQPENISLADYIVRQFHKLKRDFNFDGLFLGDGLNGYRQFTNPNLYRDQANTKDQWTEFYRVIAHGVHNLNSTLLAYDCLGLNPQEALLHGADYRSLAQVGLDYLMVQTYPTAWGKKWLAQFPGFDFNSALNNLKAIYQLLENTPCKVGYTLELGDKIEDWQTSYWTVKKQLRKFKFFAQGKLLVWANDLFYEILT